MNFKPCWWLPTAHLQTCVASLTPRRAEPTQNELIPLPDGDELELHWLEISDPTAPILLLLHGLEGSVNSPYIKGMMKVAKRNQWRAVSLHLRGSKGRINQVAQGYHAGKTDDVMQAVQYIKSRYPHAKAFYAIGYSLGANLLLKFLGENPQEKWIDKAVAVSVPFDLEVTARTIHAGFNKIYEYRFLRTLKPGIAQKIALKMEMPVNLIELMQIHTIYDFDNKMTAPLHSFKNAHEYYQRSSCAQFLPYIQTPTLIIQAEDDPLIPKAIIPKPEQVSPKVQLEIHAHGGHVGFISGGRPGKLQYWLEERIPEFFVAGITENKQS